LTVRPPRTEPVGLELVRTARTVSRAFDEALAGVGGSLPTWLILLSLKSGQHATQREIARAVGVEGPTLTHHLHRLEREGLVTRTRLPDNRRVQRVELTEAGEAAFFRMLGAVQAFDQRLRRGVSKARLAALQELLGQLRLNVGAHEEGAQ
jgi:MarR family transcriptional regulator, transcriptional regulator for hemolysin